MRWLISRWLIDLAHCCKTLETVLVGWRSTQSRSRQHDSTQAPPRRGGAGSEGGVVDEHKPEQEPEPECTYTSIAAGR